MSISSEITRLQNAKATLKNKLNLRNDNQHQITNELIDEYGNFVDSIPQGGGDIDWSQIGYSAVPQSVIDGFDYAKQIYDNWDSSQTNFSSKFSNDTKLIFMPLVNTSNGTSFSNMFNNCARLTTVPQLNTSNGTNFGSMFYYCQSLTTVPQLDTSSGTKFQSMFNNCARLTTVPQLNTSNGTNFQSMFNNCAYLTTVPQLNTSSGTNFQSMFNNCARLTTVPQLNTSSGTNFGSMFYCCQSLTTVPQLDTSSGTNVNAMFYDCLSLTTFGGLKNVGQAYLTSQSANYGNYILGLSACSNLTHDSLMNVINNLYDIATKGCNTQKLVLGSTNLAKLTASEISTATNKGWTVS